MSFDGMDGKNRKILAFDSLKLRKITMIFILGSLGPLLITLIFIWVAESHLIVFPGIWSSFF